MDKPEWTRVDNDYVIIFREGRAVIDGSGLYNPRITDNAGKIIYEVEPGFEGFDDFETADAAARANFIELDKMGMDDGAYGQKLAPRIDDYINLLSEPSRIFHRARLKNIQEWLLGEPQSDSPPPMTDWDTYTFDWKHQQNWYSCETLHGKVVIHEEPSKQDSASLFEAPAKYKIRIEDTTGAVLPDFPLEFSDFSSAEAMLREILSLLERPGVDEQQVVCVTFTLQICQRLLPPDGDPMDYVRLRYLDMWLGMSLP